MKNFILCILIFIFCLFNCSSQEESVVNPNVSKYIGWSSRILSTRAEKIITPIYEITLRKKTNNTITKFDFDVVYLYGQAFHFQDRSSFVWDKNSPELIELNTNGFITIKRELPSMGREELIKRKDIFTFTEPDGEDLQGIFEKISFIK